MYGFLYWPSAYRFSLRRKCSSLSGKCLKNGISQSFIGTERYVLYVVILRCFQDFQAIFIAFCRRGRTNQRVVNKPYLREISCQVYLDFHILRIEQTNTSFLLIWLVISKFNNQNIKHIAIHRKLLKARQKPEKARPKCFGKD